MADYAQAEYFMLIGRRNDAVHFASRALRGLAEGSAVRLRAQDIKDLAGRRTR
jgi:predicted Zn-dependent protease